MSTAWHPSTDHLKGTDIYGDPQINTAPWSVYFENLVFDQFAFSTEDLVYYIIATKEQITGSYYDQEPRMFLRSSDSPTEE